MILYVDFVKQWQRVPRTLKRLNHLQNAMGEPITLYLSNKHVGQPSLSAMEIGGKNADYNILARSRGLVRQAAEAVRGLKKGDALICRGAKIAQRLREAGSGVPRCLRVLYVHDDPFPTSVRDNDVAVSWLKPHIIFAMQPGRVRRYKNLADYAEWHCYGVDTELFYPRGVEIKCDVAMGSHVPTKIYQIRFDWMKKLAEKCDAVIAQQLSYEDYADLLASARICVDIPNSRQLSGQPAWSWQMAYRAFEIAAMGRPSLLPDLPGYKRVFGDIAFFYKPTYGGFEKSVMKLLTKRSETLDRYVAKGLEVIRSKYSLEAVTKNEAKVIRSMRGKT